MVWVSCWLSFVSLSEARGYNLSEYKRVIGKRESRGNYKAKNTLGYLGKYQLGKSALIDIGYINKKGRWLGKFGVTTERIFLNSNKVQELAMDEYTYNNMKYLRRKGTLKYVGTKFKGILITKAGLLASAHLIGAGDTNRMLRTGRIIRDAYGTLATEYLRIAQNIKID